MKSIYSILFLLSLIHCAALGQQEAFTPAGTKVVLYNDGTWDYTDSIPLYNTPTLSISKLELPKTKPKETIVSHTGFTLSYNEVHEQANWVAYELLENETYGTWERTDRFIQDRKVKTGTANDKDYAGSGYDRGHLAPAGDMAWSSTSMAESFYYSNISPQDPSFNRGIWKKLEEQVRRWAIENKALLIVTGPVLTPNLPSLGANKVSVPFYFYKVILDCTQPSVKGIGFILPNQSSKAMLQHYAVSIDSVERFTGIDFFPLLPDELEERLESTIVLKAWSWNNSTSMNIAKKTSSEAIQCKGITLKGIQCKNQTLNPSNHCYIHEYQSSESQTSPTNSRNSQPSIASQCSGTTKKGARCKNRTTQSNGRCYLH